MHNYVTSWSYTGIIHFLNSIQIDYFTRRQTQVETATYGSEFVPARSWPQVHPLYAMTKLLSAQELNLLSRSSCPAWEKDNDVVKLLDKIQPSSLTSDGVEPEALETFHSLRKVIQTSQGQKKDVNWYKLSRS